MAFATNIVIKMFLFGNIGPTGEVNQIHYIHIKSHRWQNVKHINFDYDLNAKSESGMHFTQSFNY